MRFKKEDWVNLGQRVQPTLSACFWDNWSQKNEKYEFDIPKLNGKALMMHGYSLVRKNDIDIIQSYLGARVAQEPLRVEC